MGFDGLAKRFEGRPAAATGASRVDPSAGSSELSPQLKRTTEDREASTRSGPMWASGDDLTVTGQVLGSPNYMPPEQADPRRGPATAASDVYSLGAILYHLLTGRPPFLAETLTQTLRLVGEAEVVPPRLLNPSIARDLETICLRCLEKDPRHRYSSARELADELGRFLQNEPIHARPLGLIAKGVRWCRREPALSQKRGCRPPRR